MGDGGALRARWPLLGRVGWPPTGGPRGADRAALQCGLLRGTRWDERPQRPTNRACRSLRDLRFRVAGRRDSPRSTSHNPWVVGSIPTRPTDLAGALARSWFERTVLDPAGRVPSVADCLSCAERRECVNPPRRQEGATVDQLYAEWVVELQSKGRSPNTIYGYELVYRRTSGPTLGRVAGDEGQHEDAHGPLLRSPSARLAARSVHQIHACLSSMFTQAMPMGVARHEPDSAGRAAVAAERCPRRADARRGPVRSSRRPSSRARPEYARAILVAATTHVRRAELCALRRQRDVDWERGLLTVSASIVVLEDVPLQEIPTKNRRQQTLALDELTLSILQAQVEMLEQRSALARVSWHPTRTCSPTTSMGSCPGSPTPSRSSSLGSVSGPA